MSGLARRAYRDLRLYTGDPSPCAIDVSDNTNLWGTPPSAATVLAGAATGVFRGYPEPYSASLKRAIADDVGVAPDQVVTGAGSDDILDCSFRALAAPGDQLAYIAPTFVMAPVFARTNGLRPVPVPLTDAYDADTDALVATRARIIYLCSPNNPTGGLLSRGAVETVVDRAPGVVLVDEAYTDFAGASVVDLLTRSPRLVIVRTFSKAFGLAGLRVGYALTSPEAAVEMEKARGPYTVSAVGALAAQVALEEDRAWVRDHARLAIEGREQLRAALAARGTPALPSAANFVFVPFRNAVALAAALRRCGVAVRAFSNLPLVGAGLRSSRGAGVRITIGPPHMMTAALAALDAALAEVLEREP